MTSREITVRSLSLTHDRIILVRTEIPPIGCSIVESKGWTSYTIKPAAVQKPTRNGWSKPRQGCFNGVLSKILYIISLYTFNIIIISVTYTLIACAHKSCCLVCMYEWMDEWMNEWMNKSEMDMDPYFWPSPTANGSNPTQPMIFFTGVTQPKFDSIIRYTAWISTNINMITLYCTVKNTVKLGSIHHSRQQSHYTVSQKSSHL